MDLPILDVINWENIHEGLYNLYYSNNVLMKFHCCYDFSYKLWTCVRVSFYQLRWKTEKKKKFSCWDSVSHSDCFNQHLEQSQYIIFEHDNGVNTFSQPLPDTGYIHQPLQPRSDLLWAAHECSLTAVLPLVDSCPQDQKLWWGNTSAEVRSHLSVCFTSGEPLWEVVDK